MDESPAESEFDAVLAAMNRELRAARAAVLKTLIDAITAEYKKLRDDVDDDLRTAYQQDGTTGRAVHVLGKKVARLTLSKADASMAIDNDALLKWVEARYPTEVLTQTYEEKSVRGAFAGQLMGRLVWDEEAEAIVDPETGEAVPFARLVPAGRGTVSLTFEKGGRAFIEQAWRDGEPHVLELMQKPVQLSNDGLTVEDRAELAGVIAEAKVTAHAQTEGENRSQPDRSQTDNDQDRMGSISVVDGQADDRQGSGGEDG